MQYKTTKILKRYIQKIIYKIEELGASYIYNSFLRTVLHDHGFLKSDLQNIGQNIKWSLVYLSFHLFHTQTINAITILLRLLQPFLMLSCTHLLIKRYQLYLLKNLQHFQHTTQDWIIQQQITGNYLKLSNVLICDNLK